MDPLTRVIVEVRDWVYDHYPSAFVLGTFCIFYTMFMPDLKLFLIFWVPCLLVGLLLEPCVNPENLTYGAGLVRLTPAGNEKPLALTFDDGPGPSTPQLLELLQRQDIKATFFLIGQQIEKYPQTVRLIHEAGHVIGNHTYSHPSLLMSSPSATEEELRKTQDLVVSLTGRAPGIFRPPYGYRAPWTAKSAATVQLRQVLWSLNPRDFQHPGVGVLVRRIESKVRAGDIILLHDGREECSQTLEALEIVIPKLRAAGFHFESLQA